MVSSEWIRIAEPVARAIAEGRPVVTLESNVIAHGLPHPINLETARACEEAVRQEGAVPATIGLVDGMPTIGLNSKEILVFAGGEAPNGSQIEKVSLSNLAAAMLKKAWGATTVASTMRIALLARADDCEQPLVFSTGGIGGIHRGAINSFDASADLVALATTRLVCVCAGAKSVLDLPKTRECLETIGVPVVGYATQEFPAFYSRGSGLAVDFTVQTPDEAARLALSHWRMGGRGAVMVCVPVPDEFELPIEQIERATLEAIGEARRLAISGKALTPFLLSRIEELTEGRSTRTNRAVLINNASVAARIAAALMATVR
jgi:pseudouridine-5'-phosphate glycosidase